MASAPLVGLPAGPLYLGPSAGRAVMDGLLEAEP